NPSDTFKCSPHVMENLDMAITKLRHAFGKATYVEGKTVSPDTSTQIWDDWKVLTPTEKEVMRELLRERVRNIGGGQGLKGITRLVTIVQRNTEQVQC